MIKDSGKRLFDMIIVWKLDRFARNRYDLSLIHIFPALEVVRSLMTHT